MEMKTAWFFNASSFVLRRRKKITQVWNTMTVSKMFKVYYPF